MKSFVKMHVWQPKADSRILQIKSVYSSYLFSSTLYIHLLPEWLLLLHSHGLLDDLGKQISMGCSCTKYNAGARKHLVYHYHTCRHRLWVVVHLLETARAGYQVTVSCSQGLSYICNKHSLSHTREMLAPTSVASYACILPRAYQATKGKAPSILLKVQQDKSNARA